MKECLFCVEVSHPGPSYFFEDTSGCFVAKWDPYPVRPGHALVIPKRHAARMEDLPPNELCALGGAVAEVKALILKTDLSVVYAGLKRSVGEKSLLFVQAAEVLLDRFNHQLPDAFNDGINDGPAAGQTVPHFHWHIMPRWDGDVEDVRGGIRHMFPGVGNYTEGLKR